MASAQTAATSAQRAAATKDFRTCRDMERYGDATSCWRLWLVQHQATGGEAEIMVAEERARNGTPPSAPPTPPANRPLPSPQATPPAPTSSPMPTPPREPSPNAGSDPAATAPPTSPIEPPQDKGANPSASAVETGGADLCQFKSNQDATQFSKQKVLVFGVANAHSLETDSKLRAANAARHLTTVFLQRFPLSRFHNAVTNLSGLGGWEATQTLALSAVEARVKEHGAGAAANLTRQLSCADFVVFPTLTSHEAKKASFSGQIAGKSATTDTLELSVKAALGIFKRDGGSWRLVATLNASVPGLGDGLVERAALAADQAAAPGAQALGSANEQLTKTQTAATQTVATIDKVAKGDVAGVANIGTTPGAPCSGAEASCKSGDHEPLIAAPDAGKLHERLSQRCKAARAEPDPKARERLLLACEVRVRAAQLALAFQEEARDVEGWKLFGLLQFGVDADAETPAIALGDEEGVSVGDGYYAYDAQRQRLAYFKVTRVGPGGTAGNGAPSALALRSGEASAGARLEEYPLWGLSLSAHAAFAVLPFTFGEIRTPPVDAAGNQVNGALIPFSLPTAAFGAGATLGYDLSGLLSWSESYVRAGATYFIARNGLGTTLSLLPLDLTFEKGFYLGKALSLSFGLGGSMTFVNVQIIEDATLTANGVEGNPYPQELKASRIGGVSRLGLELLLHPRFALHLDGVFRMNLPSTTYEAASGEVRPGFAVHSDGFSTAGATLGAAFTL